MALATGFIGIPELMEYQLFRAQQWLSVRPITAPLGLLSHRTLKLNRTQRLSSFYQVPQLPKPPIGAMTGMHRLQGG